MYNDNSDTPAFIARASARWGYQLQHPEGLVGLWAVAPLAFAYCMQSGRNIIIFRVGNV